MISLTLAAMYQLKIDYSVVFIGMATMIVTWQILIKFVFVPDTIDNHTMWSD